MPHFIELALAGRRVARPSYWPSGIAVDRAPDPVGDPAETSRTWSSRAWPTGGLNRGADQASTGRPVVPLEADLD